MIELLLQFIGEFLLQVIGEALIELGLHSLAEPFRKPPNPWLASVGYLIFGAIAGALSLWAFPHNFTPEGPLRLVNLILTPIAVGILMTAMGAWRARKGEPLLRINQFFYGFLFALAWAAVRFFFAR